MNTTLYKSALYLTTALSVGIAAPAYAQDSGAAATASDGLADIVVTARRVEERLQDVPISITVFSQDQLNKQNVSTGKDLVLYTPSLSANSRYGSDYASFAIRGFVQEARTTSSVGVYFADVVLPRSSPVSAGGDGAGPGAMFDLQNVQVLKGPQGTLFGRNTTGGAVVLVPQRPTSKFEGYVEGSYGNYDMRRLQAVVNVPVSDTIRMRAGVDWQKRDGYLKNVATFGNGETVGPKDFANIDYIAARFSVVADLTPDVENYTVATYSKSTPNGSVPKITDCYRSASSLSASDQYQYACQQIQAESAAGKYAVANSVPWAHQELTTWQAINTTKWLASDTLTVKNIMSYGKSIQDQAIDSTGRWTPTTASMNIPTSTGHTTVAPASQYVGLGWGGDSLISADGHHAGNQGTFTEELQLQGRADDDKLIWQAGAYYERSKPIGYSGTQTMSGALCSADTDVAMTLWQGFACNDARIATGSSRAVGSRNLAIAKVNFHNVGLYAQGTYKFTPQLSVDAGFRYTWDKSWGSSILVTANYLTSPYNVPTFVCTDPVTYQNTFSSCEEHYRQSSNAPTWMIGLNYKPTDDILLYAKYSRGYRQGAVYPQGVNGFKSYKPESVDVYEAGLKSSWRGAIPGTFNITGFYNKFSNMQLQTSFQDLNGVGPTLSPGPAIVNAGKSKIYGFEVETTLRPVDGLSLQISYAYLKTKLLAFTDPVKDPITNTYDGVVGGYDTLSSKPKVGAPLILTPDHKLTVGANYTLPLSDEIGKVSFGATYVYTGKVYHGEDASSAVAVHVGSIFAPTDPRYNPSYAPGYSLANFNLSWEHVMQSNVNAQFFITNAFNKIYYDNRTLSGSRGFIARYISEPRMYGIRLKYSFGR